MDNTFTQLKVFFASPRNDTNKEAFFSFVTEPINNFSSPKIQNFLLNNWWKSNPYTDLIHHGKREPREDIINFYNSLSWNQLVRTKENCHFNIRTYVKNYQNADISWFHYGLLAHWTLITEGINFIKQPHQAISLENSLGENSWHVFARSLEAGPRVNYLAMVHIIEQFNEHDLRKKNHRGETPFDILQLNIDEYSNWKTKQDKMVLDINKEAYQTLEKLLLTQTLNINLEDNKVVKNKLKI